MNTILTIAAFVAAVTVFEIVKAVIAHAKAKDEIKLLEAKFRAEEARKSAVEIEQKSQEVKASLASTLSTLTEEQLATYNRTLMEMQRPVTQYVPVVQYVPIYISRYIDRAQQFYPYDYGPQAWRGW